MGGPHVTITDPDDLMTVIYDGPAAEAHQRLIPGLYVGSSLEEHLWTLYVTDHSTTVGPAEDHPDDSIGVPVHLLQQALTALTAWARLTGRSPTTNSAASDLAVYDHLRSISNNLQGSPEDALRRLVTDHWQLGDASEAHQQYVHETVTDALEARGLSRG